MDTHGEDMLDIHTPADFRRLVMDSLDKLNLLKKEKSFKFHVEQCKSLCTYILEKLAPYMDNNGQYLRGDVWSKRVHRAWKEIYRAVKEAEAYLRHCSTDSWWMKSFILSNTGEAFALHMHDLAWSIFCLDLALLCPIEDRNDRFHLRQFRNKISDFFGEMSDLHLEQFGFKFQDYWHLLMACNQTAAMAWTFKRKKKIGVLQFMEKKLLETIRNEYKIESATGIPTWLQIPPKDLIKKKRIGEGSFGEVYEGSWLGHKVAVKDIPIDARDLFDRETAVLAKLQSPFIVQLIGTCVEGGHCYIVMELVSSSLDKLLKNSRGRAPLALPVAVDMMLQISRGMEYLHRQGVMHMDLKASNVLIQPSVVPEFRKQGYGQVKLCDFGMASLRLSSFRCEDPKGTCYWRAPEAFPFPDEKLLQEIDALMEYTHKADVYSFAMTCYEILTREQPFLGVHPKDLYRMIVQGRRPILQRASCPGVLADYIVNCWETDPRRRPCFAQVSTFMRNMKLFMLRWNDPRDWLAKSDENFYLSEAEVSLELVTSKEEAFDESPEDEKLKSISKILHIIPPEIKRRYNINGARAMPSEKSNAKGGHPTLVFENMEVLGKGSFGTTYRANSLDPLVVKRSSRETTYMGDKRYFERCLQALRSLKHTNLVSLEDYCTSKEEKILIYKYLPNGSLYSLLHSEIEPKNLRDRREIAMDVGLGLAYLHKLGVVHGNVKSSNVLLDDNGRACLTDSCLAGLVKNSSVANKSWGYMAPERHHSGKMTEQSDVYSFGVLLLELVTRKDPSSGTIQLPTGTIKAERWTTELELSSLLGIAMSCTSPHADTRPKMSKVVEMLANLQDRHL